VAINPGRHTVNCNSGSCLGAFEEIRRENMFERKEPSIILRGGALEGDHGLNSKEGTLPGIKASPWGFDPLVFLPCIST
jgi:hypothetical protein